MVVRQKFKNLWVGNKKTRPGQGTGELISRGTTLVGRIAATHFETSSPLLSSIT
jgi:hypothetical protein